MCSQRMLAPALVPPTVTPLALRARMSFATAVPPRSVVSRNWFPPVKKMPLASSIRSSRPRSEEHTSELQSHHDLVCRLLLEKKKKREIKTKTTKNKITNTE